MSTPLTPATPARTVNKAGAAWFEVSPQAVDGWIRRGCPAEQVGAQGRPWLFDLLRVSEWRFAGKSTTSSSSSSDRGDDPEQMTPNDRLHWYKGTREKIRYMEEASQLIPAGEYETALSSALKLVAMTLESLPDVLERDAGISGEAVERCQTVIDRMREDLYQRLTAVDGGAVTPWNG